MIIEFHFRFYFSIIRVTFNDIICFSFFKVSASVYRVFFPYLTDKSPHDVPLALRHTPSLRKLNSRWSNQEEESVIINNLQKVTSVIAPAENVALPTECTQYNCGRRSHHLQFFSGSFWILGSEVFFSESFQSVSLQTDHVPIKPELPLSFKVAVVTISWPLSRRFRNSHLLSCEMFCATFQQTYWKHNSTKSDVVQHCTWVDAYCFITEQ